MIKFLTSVLLTLIVAISPADAQKPSVFSGPLVDQEKLLSDRAAAEIRKAALSFKEETGHWMVFVVSSHPVAFDRSQRVAAWERRHSPTPIGLVYAVSPKEKLGEMAVIAPDWQAVTVAGWIPMFPQRLVQKFGDQPFEARTVNSAQYLAATFPDKIAFLLKPDTGPISEESTEYARRMMKGIEYFCYFIILFTFYRTFFPARVKDEDTDDFSNELRRLKRERRIW